MDQRHRADPKTPSVGHTVSNIEPSRHRAGVAYITVDFHQVNNRDPYVYKTTDFGHTWQAITTGLPHNQLSYAHCIREDPEREGLLYLGTENGLYVSFDDGVRWRPLQANLPHAPVHWLAIQPQFGDLAVATYGRGFWILDDLSPLRQFMADTSGSTITLFSPRPTYRFQSISEPMSHADSSSEFPALRGHDPSAGSNPPYGAPINYFLAAPSRTEPSIRIVDAHGQVVRTLPGSNRPGINRVWWDLRGELSSEIRLRTSPAFAPYVHVNTDGWRRLPEESRISILMPPGAYTVKLTVDGHEYAEPLIVKKDPNSAGSEAEIRAQVQLLTAIRSDLGRAAELVNSIETIRWQLDNLSNALAARAALATVERASSDLARKILVLEDQLIQRKYTGNGDGVRWPGQLVSKLAYLADGVANADFPPTNQDREVYESLAQRLGAISTEFETIIRADVPAFNDLLKQQQIGNIIPRR